VTDTTLGSFGLLESITSWEDSSEPSLSDHRHILFTGLRTGTPDQGHQLRLLSRRPEGQTGDVPSDERER